MDDLLQEFIAETRETLAALSGEIVAWEASPSDRGRLDAIFRFVHTVKGSCGFLDLPRLARLSHAAEDVLQDVRSGDRVPDTRLVNAVLAVVDRIGAIVEAIDAGNALDDSTEDQLLAALKDKEALTPAPAVASVATLPRAPARSIRLSVDLLDRMMNGVSELVLARNELSRRLRDIGDVAVDPAVERLSMTIADMRETVARSRMQAIDALFSALPRLVRDTAATLGRAVTLTVDGGDVELDREMIELLRDPLVHIVRNAIDHGIEPPEERRRAGKPDTGRLSIIARQSGNRIIVEIADDGRGIDTARLVAKRIAQEPGRAAALNALGERARVDLIFEPGLSTRDEVTATSGRGVGMDVVRTNVEQIGGCIRLDNAPGRGLTTTIEVPLTLAILSAIIVDAGGGRYAVPRGAVEEIVAVGSSAVRIDRVGDALLATVRGRRLPVIALGDLLGVGGGVGAMLVVVNLPGGSFALGVDLVDDTQELVVKPVAPGVAAARIYAGQVLLDTGEPMLLLDCAGIAAAAGVTFHRAIAAEPEPEEPTAEGWPALLVEALDGDRAIVPLATIERIEAVPAGAIRQAGGRWWATGASGVVPLIVDAAIPGDEEALSMLLVEVRGETAGYLVRRALDIVTVSDEPLRVEGRVGGVVVIDGEPIELIDPTAAPDADARRPICLVSGSEAGWVDSVLRPMVEAAGYRVVARLAGGETAAVTLVADDAVVAGDGPVVRVRRDAAGRPQVDPQQLARALAAGAGR